MVAVIFEVEVKPEGREEYLQIASKLREKLEQMDGFISIERFASLSQEGKMLSLSFWENEESVNRWAKHSEHMAAQQKGKDLLFSGFKLRVAEVLRETEL